MGSGLNRSVMISGGIGFLGQYLIEQIAEEFSVSIVDLRKPTQTDVSYVECDITRFDSVSTAFEQVRPDIVVHLAAVTGVERCMMKPYESFLTNVVGTFNVAYLSARNRSRLVFASSREVYGESGPDETSEDDELHPKNLYGLTKQLGESTIKWIHSSMDLRYVILRFTNLYGPGGDQYAVSAIAKKAIEDADIPVYGGDQSLNLIDVRDAARAIDTCLTKTDVKDETFNIGHRRTVKVSDLVKRILYLSDSKSKLIPMPMRPGDVMNFRPNLSKARGELGFEARIDLDQGILDCINAHRARGSN